MFRNDTSYRIRIFSWWWGWRGFHQLQICWISSTRNSLQVAKCRVELQITFTRTTFYFILRRRSQRRYGNNQLYYLFYLFIFILLKGVLLFSPDFISLTLPSVFQESANSFGTNYISEVQTWSFVVNFKVFREYGRSGWNLYNTLQKLWGKSFIFHVREK